MQSAGISQRNRGIVEKLNRAFTEPFTADDVAEHLGLDRAKASRLTRYLADRGWLDRVRRGFYLPVPLDAHQSGSAHKDPWIVGSVLFEPAYVAGWSAAEYWDLTEQIFRSVVMATARRPRDRQPTIGSTEFFLHTVPLERHIGLVHVWRDGRRVNITDPSKTIVDLLADPAWGGGIRSVVDMLDEYLDSEHRDDEKLVHYADEMQNGAIFKRLGYILETCDIVSKDLVDDCLKRRSAGVNELDPSVHAPGKILTRWGIRANVALTPIWGAQ